LDAACAARREGAAYFFRPAARSALAITASMSISRRRDLAPGAASGAVVRPPDPAASDRRAAAELGDGDLSAGALAADEIDAPAVAAGRGDFAASRVCVA
jgi:hypothetical protein